MNRTKSILTSLRVANSLLLSRAHSAARPLLPSHDVTTPLLPRHQSHSPPPPHFLTQTLTFCSSASPNSVIQLVLSKPWSPELETELTQSNPPALTHDVIIYVVKKLSKDPEKAWSFFNWVCETRGFRPGHMMLSLMLRVLAHKDTMRQFWETLMRMKEEGLYVDAQTCLTILESLKTAKMDVEVSAFKHFCGRMVQENAVDEGVKKVVDVILGGQWGENVEKELAEIGVVLMENFVVSVIRELRGYPLKALRFFRWAEESGGYEHNNVTYNGMAFVLGQASSIGEFWNLIEEMKEKGEEVDLDTYIKLTRHFRKNKMVADAVKLYERMMDGPYKPSVQDVSMLLRSLAESERLEMDLVHRVVKKFESAGFTLTKAVYDGIHRSLTNLGRFDEAEDTLTAMRSAGFEPDNITYSQLVFGLCKAKKLNEACKLLDDMEENGCVPDIKTWTILISGHFAANEPDKALICFAKMMEKECKADADLLEVLLNGLVMNGRVDGAYKLLVEMVNTAQIRPWQATFKNLIENLLGVRKLEEAMELLCSMKKQGYPPYPEPFVGYISKFGSVEDASEFFKALSVKEYPSSAAYVHVFKAFLKEGRHAEARDLLYKCPHHIRKLGEVRRIFTGATERNKISVA